MQFGARSVALAVAAVAFAIAAVAGGACIVVPPPELPIAAQPPRILRQSVTPSPDAPLLAWPAAGFVVPVDPETQDDPAATLTYVVLVDQQELVNEQAPPPGDAGLALISFTVDPQNLTLYDAGACRHVTFIIARTFSNNFVPQRPGGDSVLWTYAGSNPPDECVYSALDGQAPIPSDAADGPFIPPSDGGGADL
jgi:hypothetical protein